MKFVIDDAQLEWMYPDNEFDLVHLRILVGCIDNWPLLYSRAFKATKPGGWIEHMETDVVCSLYPAFLAAIKPYVKKYLRIF